MTTFKLHELNRRDSAGSATPTPAATMPKSARRPELRRYALLALAAFYVIVSLYFIIDTRNRLSSFERAQQSWNARMWMRQATTESDLKVSTEALGQRLGMTEQDLHQRMQARATEWQRQQQALDKRLQQQQNEQAAQKEQIGQFTGEVANVRNELGSAKMDIAATRTDLEFTKVKLERAIGDLTGQGTLIAHTRDELEELRHRGDRNYYEFSLSKGARPTSIATVGLQLKKANAKKNKFTLNVIADDRTIEKKDRGVAEPLQFYTGRDRVLYEVVIFSVEKNAVTGYLSTPKSVGIAMAAN